MYRKQIKNINRTSEIKHGDDNDLFKSAIDFIFTKNKGYGFHISDMLGFIVDESPKQQSIGQSLEISLDEEELIDFKFHSLIIKKRFDELKSQGISYE